MSNQTFSEKLTDASILEQRAMVADRAGSVPEAIDLYHQAVDRLGEAVRASPANHPDADALDKHISEIQNRVSYLLSLSPTAQPLIPVESHISPVELSVTAAPASSISQGSAMGMAATIGGVGGLLLLGPIGLVAGAAGAAYASTRSDNIGQATRGVARSSINMVDKVVDVNREHGIVDKAKHMGSAAINKAAEIDEKYEVTATVKTAGTEAFKRLSTFDQTYGITDKISSGVASGFSALSNFLQPSSSPGQTTPQPHQQYTEF